MRTEDVILLLQRVLVLLGSASHTLTKEKKEVSWFRVSPMTIPPPEGKKEKELALFSGGFLEKATKRIEEKKALAMALGSRQSGSLPLPKYQ